MMSKSAIRNGTLLVAVCGVLAWSWPSGAHSAEQVSVASGAQAELEADTPPQTVPEKIDGVFAKAVEVVETLLFTRLFQTDRDFVTYTHREVYVRDRGTQGSYQRWGDAKEGRQELTERDLRFMAARGELLAGQTIAGEPQQYSWGKIGDRLVETITVQIPTKLPALQLNDGDKFAFEDRSVNAFGFALEITFKLPGVFNSSH